MILDDLKIELFEYKFVPIDESNLKDMFELMQSNLYFYKQAQEHIITFEEFSEKLTALPPDIPSEQRFLIGVYSGNELISIFDYIEGFPKKKIVYLDLFMMHANKQDKGTGKILMKAFIKTVRENNFTEIDLKCYESNELGIKFLKHLGFSLKKVTEEIVDGKAYKLIHMLKQL